MDDVPDGATADRDADRARDARDVEAALGGDQRAFGRLYDAWFDRVFNLSLGIVRDREVAAEVAQDAFLSAWKNLAGLDDRNAFGGWLLRIARNASFNRAKKEGRSTAVDDQGLAVIEQVGASPVSAPAGFGVEERLGRLDDPARVAEDGELAALVHEAAAALGERDAEVLDLQLRYGLGPAEIGEVIGMNRNAANQLCHRIRQRFATAVQARVLWNGSRPACDALDALLTSAGVTSFDAEAVKLADKHARDCDRCAERRELRLQPAAMFAAVPLLAAPVMFKTKVAAALEGAGVPMDGSAFSGAASGGDAGQSSDAPGEGGGSTSGADQGPGSVQADGAGPQQGDPVGATAAADGAPVARRVSRRSLRIAAMAGMAVLVLLALVVALAERPHDGTLDTEAAASDRSSSTTTSTTQAPLAADTEPPADVTSSTVVLDFPVDDPVLPLPEPQPQPEPVPEPESPTTTVLPTVRFTATQPNTVTWIMVNTPDAPRVRWLVTGGGAARVTITPPAVDTQSAWAGISALTGEQVVCPSTVQSGPVPTFCTALSGSHTYVLRVYDAADQLLVTRSVTVTVPTSPPTIG